jgi:hypothetical protein
MPDVREVYEMVTKQKPPEHGALERQRRRQVRAARNKKIGAFVVAAAIALVAVAVLLSTREQAPQQLGPPDRSAVNSPTTDASALDVATGFVKAYGAFDAERAIGYLADGASVSALGGANGVGAAPEDWPLGLSWWRAAGYRQTHPSCEETGTSTSGVDIHCSYDYENFGSDRLGRGPFTGSYWDLTVRDGKIVWADQYCEIARFSPRMWEPFAAWVSQAYPKDAAVMYPDSSLSDFVVSPRSIALWEQHTKEYVQQVRAGTAS